MKKLLLGLIFFVLLFALPSWAQPSTSQGDIGFSVGTLLAPSSNSAGVNYSPQTMGGGTYLAVNGNYLFWHHLGAGGEIAWRASQNLYQGFQPFRPVFYDFGATYGPPLGKHAQAQFTAGIGGASTRFYTNTFVCNFVTCTNYADVNHFMGAFGAGVKLKVHGGVFLRPEVKEYLIHNNFEFSSGHATRVGATLGYTFSGGYY